MAFMFLLSFVLLGSGFVYAALAAGGVFFATPFVYITWQLLAPPRHRD